LFFNQPEAAEQAGFRACRRCYPREIRMNRKTQLVGKVCKEIANHPEDSVSLKSLAKLTGLSPAHLQRTFREAMGISPRQYADTLRVARLKSELRKGSDVTTALHEVSYGSASRLYEKSDAQLGMTPATYRKGGLGMNISYTIADSSMGRVLVAGTERGISAVYLGDKDSDLAAALREEYPQAEIQTVSEGKSKWVRKIVAHLDQSNSPLDLPTDVAGTAFQRRVWQALREIPLGATRTYSDVARAIGQPTAIRAVGRLRDKSCIDCGAVPQSDSHGWKLGRLPLGFASQTIPAGKRTSRCEAQVARASACGIWFLRGLEPKG
jgi:AraC family transcriptional regulator of adaptative response/methylated-DNA-[protein]-cysteine methyltransferase